MLIVSGRYTQIIWLREANSIPPPCTPISAPSPHSALCGCEPIPVAAFKTTCTHIGDAKFGSMKSGEWCCYLPGFNVSLFASHRKNSLITGCLQPWLERAGEASDCSWQLSQQIHGFIYLYFIKSAFNGLLGDWIQNGSLQLLTCYAGSPRFRALSGCAEIPPRTRVKDNILRQSQWQFWRFQPV